MSEHLSEIQKSLAAQGKPIGAPTKEHLEACAECQSEVDLNREVEDLLRDPRSWEFANRGEDFADHGSASFDKSWASLQHFEKMLREEDGAAAELIERAQGDPRALRAAIARTPASQTAGMVRELIDRSTRERERHPAAALELSLIGRDAAARLPEDRYPKGTPTLFRGLAEKEYANALRVLGRYDEAFAALDRAEVLLSQGTVCDYDLAIVMYVRGLLCAATDQPERALALAIESAEVLEEFGDITRVAHSRMLEAMIRAGRGEVKQAAAILDALLDRVQKANDTQTLAALLANLGNLAIEEGNLDMAATYFECAENLHRSLGLLVQIAKADWHFGVVLVRAGRIPEGVDRLERARQAFLSQALPGEVAALSLELVDSLLASGEARRAHEICQTLPQECQRLGMPRNVILALAYLKECESAGRLSREETERIRVFLQRVSSEPNLEFLPAPE